MDALYPGALRVLRIDTPRLLSKSTNVLRGHSCWRNSSLGSVLGLHCQSHNASNFLGEPRNRTTTKREGRQMELSSGAALLIHAFPPLRARRTRAQVLCPKGISRLSNPFKVEQELPSWGASGCPVTRTGVDRRVQSVAIRKVPDLIVFLRQIQLRRLERNVGRDPHCTPAKPPSKFGSCCPSWAAEILPHASAGIHGQCLRSVILNVHAFRQGNLSEGIELRSIAIPFIVLFHSKRLSIPSSCTRILGVGQTFSRLSTIPGHARQIA